MERKLENEALLKQVELEKEASYRNMNDLAADFGSYVCRASGALEDAEQKQRRALQDVGAVFGPAILGALQGRSGNLSTAVARSSVGPMVENWMTMLVRALGRGW